MPEVPLCALLLLLAPLLPGDAHGVYVSHQCHRAGMLAAGQRAEAEASRGSAKRGSRESSMTPGAGRPRGRRQWPGLP